MPARADHLHTHGCFGVVQANREQCHWMTGEGDCRGDTQPLDIVLYFVSVDLLAIELFDGERRHRVARTQQQVDILEKALELTVKAGLLCCCPGDLFGSHLQTSLHITSDIRTQLFGKSPVVLHLPSEEMDTANDPEDLKRAAHVRVAALAAVKS